MNKKLLVIFLISLSVLTFVIYTKNTKVVHKVNQVDPLIGMFTPIELIPLMPEVQWQNYPPVRSKHQDNSHFSDIGNHTTEDKLYGDSREITAHEWNHGIHSDLRDGLINSNGFYVGKDRSKIFQEPKTTIEQAATLVPNSLHGDRYDLYMVQMRRDWDDAPLYIFDEFVAYQTSTQVAIEEAQAGRRATITNEAFSCLEFSIYALAVCMAIREQDPNYWENNEQFRAFVGFLLKKAMNLFIMAQRYPTLRWEQANEYYERLQSVEGKPFRDLAFELTGEDIFDVEFETAKDNIPAWNRFVKDGLVCEEDIQAMNTKYSFPKMTKQFGRAYIEYLSLIRNMQQQMQQECPEFAPSDEELCKLNGNVPLTFWQNKICKKVN